MNFAKTVVLRATGYIISHLAYFYYQLRWSSPAHPEKIIWVKPAEIIRSIEFTDIVQQRRYYLNGIISKGKWGKTESTVHTIHQPLFDAFRDKFLKGKEFEETSFFKEYRRKNKSVQSFKDKYDVRYQEIYERIKESGFHVPKGVFDEFDAYKISIAANGDFLFMTGKHRLAISLLMDDDFEIPVKVSHRHIEWQNIRETILSNENSELRKKLLIKYGNHPDIFSELKIDGKNMNSGQRKHSDQKMRKKTAEVSIGS